MACPSCGGKLQPTGFDVLRCPADASTVRRKGGIWRLLSEAESEALGPFRRDYRAVRRAEGWGADDDTYYRGLPFVDHSGLHPEIWRIRARSYSAFLGRVLGQGETDDRQRILDLGAGNCWLSYRLSLHGHDVAAVDVDDDPRDGLGAWVRYGDPRFAVVQATFDRLPWPHGVVDLAIYNGSLHYSSDYRRTLTESLRLLAPGGRLVILDSPFYRRSVSGMAMVRERQAAHRTEHGCNGAGPAGEAFLTRSRLDDLGRELGLEWRLMTPYYGIRWALQPLRNRLRRRREPSRFHVVVGRRGGSWSGAEGRR